MNIELRWSKADILQYRNVVPYVTFPKVKWWQPIRQEVEVKVGPWLDVPAEGDTK